MRGYAADLEDKPRTGICMSDLLSKSPFDPVREPRLVVFADSLPPDFGAVGQYALLRAQAFAERGHQVDLFGLTSAAASVEHSEHGRGLLTVTRMSASPVPRGSLFARLVWTLWTNLRLVSSAFRRVRAADGVLFTGSPPFLIHFLAPLRFLLKGRLVYRITDFHPECLMAAQDRPSRALRVLQRLTNFWRRRIDAFEVLGEDQRRRLREQGIADARISLVRDGSPIVVPEKEAARALPPELEGKCVLLYSGNFDIAHELETVARGYQLHHQSGSGRVHLWINATGMGAGVLSDRLAASGVPFFRSMPVPLEQLAGLLLSADAHLVTLKDSFVGFVMPSKIYAILELHRPLLFVGNPESDIDLLARQQASLPYWQIACGNAAGFATALESLADHVKPSS
jgi:Glycosyl transferase 4-like domain